MNKFKGFTLIELLVVISIIAFLSSVVFATMATSRKKARDSQRVLNARQIAVALEQYEQTNQTYKISSAGLLSNPGTGYVAKTGGSYSGNSILSVLKSSGFLQSASLKDPVYNLDNYYIGLCTSTNAYNIFVKLEQAEYNSATSSIVNTCGGAAAAAEGFSYIGATTGGTAGGGTNGVAGSYEYGMTGGSGSDILFNGLTYKEVVAEDGRIWLDRNLGATKVAAAYDDYLSYGNLFQWGRGADGHERRTCTGPSSCTSDNGNTTTLSSGDSPGNVLFIRTSVDPFDWRSTPNDNLWATSTGNINNPCPPGYRVPTTSEWQKWYSLVSSFGSCSVSSTCRAAAANSSLKLPSAGVRSTDANLYNLSTHATYWSSSINGVESYNFYVAAGIIYPQNSVPRGNGFPVRCIKN